MVACVQSKADGLNLGCDHIAEQFAALGLSEVRQSFTLRRVGALVHDKHGFGREGIAEGIAKRGARADHGSNAQSIERNVLPSAFLHVPRQDSFFASQVDLRIGEARTGVNVRGTRLDVFTGDVPGWLGRPRARGQSDQSPREKE